MRILVGRVSAPTLAAGCVITPKMGPRYRETCARNLRLHLQPLDDVPLRAITPTIVREWYAAAMRGVAGVLRSCSPTGSCGLC
jgi:hypothetical protein